MKITLESLENGSTQKRTRSESQEAFLRRITHVSLVGKGIEVMDNLHLLKNLTVLYLYDNKITQISGLECCRGLTRLYLQNNAIEEITGLDVGLDRVNVLHLQNNRIRRLSGLHALPSLEYLKLDHQQIEPEQQLDFDIASLEALAPSLRHLTLTGNRIRDISSLGLLSELEELDLAGNGIEDVESLEHLLESCTHLATLNVSDNPVASGKSTKLRQKLILANNSLACLNEKDIPAVERAFVENMQHAQRSRRSSRDDVNNPNATHKFGLAANTMDKEIQQKPLPHLPPYATQYRDLILQNIAKSTASIDNTPSRVNRQRPSIVARAGRVAKAAEGLVKK